MLQLSRIKAYNGLQASKKAAVLLLFTEALQELPWSPDECLELRRVATGIAFQPCVL